MLPITFGSMVEWFEVYLYSYWAPLMSESFFNLSIPFAELIYACIILGTGLIARPFGGILFGYIGDKLGRRKSFLFSIVGITIPSIFIMFMPTFSSWAYFSLVYIGIARFLQAMPAGGEVPGALCLLYEGAGQGRARYLCSYLFVGPQLGQILSMLLCFFLEAHLSREQLVNWGWRFSFGVSTLIGIASFFLRRRLHESSAFESIKTHQKIEGHPLRESFRYFKKSIWYAFGLSLLEVVGFFMVYFYLFQNSKEILRLDSSKGFVVYFLHLLFLTCIMPIIGSISGKFKTISLLKLSAVGTIIVCVPFYLSIASGSAVWMIFVLSFLVLFLCIQFSILPSFLAGLFPTYVRFTCLGFSFNIANGIIGGMAPYTGDVLMQLTNNPASFALLFPLPAALFLYFLKKVAQAQGQNPISSS